MVNDELMKRRQSLAAKGLENSTTIEPLGEESESRFLPELQTNSRSGTSPDANISFDFWRIALTFSGSASGEVTGGAALRFSASKLRR